MNAHPVPYTIRVEGHLGAAVLCAFPGLVAETQIAGNHVAQTVLTGLLDRSALYGVLAQMEMLGLELLAVQQIRPEPDVG